MTAKIYCEEQTRGMLTFFIRVNGKEHFLFAQKYKRSVQEFFANPITISNSIEFSKSRRDYAISKTMEKIPMYIRYYENLNNVAILKKTIKSQKKYA